MKKKSFVLFLLILVGLFIMDRVVFTVLHGVEKNVFTGQSVGKANQFNKAKDSVDLLVMGSSRAARHVDPSVFPMPGFNMGMDGTHLGYATALMSTLERRHQLILVHVDHHEVYDVDYDGEDMLALMNETLDSKKMQQFIKQYFPEEILLSEISRCYIYNGKVLGMVKNYMSGRKNFKLSNGYSPLVPTAEQKQTFQKILDKDGLYQEIEISESVPVNANFESYVDFAMEVANRNDSKLVFFTSPSLNKVDGKVRQRTVDFFAAKNVKYMDDLDFFKDFDIDYWKDRSHMSKIGAEIYSEKLRENLIKLVR